MAPVYFRNCAVACAVISQYGFAAGTLVSEMSHLNVGTAGAGTAALAQGASTAYANPAAMGLLKEKHFALNLATMALDIQYSDNRNELMDSDNAGGVQPYGSIYSVTPLSNRFALGIALAATGGSGLDYGNEYAGRLGLNDLSLSVMQLNPSLSYRLNEKWHIGLGVQIDRAQFEQSFLANQAEIESSSYAFGYNIGATYQIDKAQRLGVTYRSKMEHQLDGKLSLLNQEGETSIGLLNAARMEVSGLHHWVEPFTLLWSIGQEYWSENEATVIEFGHRTVTKTRQFDDVWFASLGGQVALSDRLSLEMGVGYVSSPLDDPSLQSSDLPVDSQMKYSAGAQYRLSRTTDLKAYYSYVDYGSPKIDKGLMNGSFDNHNQFFGVEIDYKF
ncbi:OmpP1/FadL family transporter [Vibrio agarivorans]|uniref:OmpP1/FadL family transporter n=1 Tax=Vibrio agarivorans TaxID=153622 RepID=UPI002230AC9B|nr:outer membrane protein transport protein [Vibrio agarivorans]